MHDATVMLRRLIMLLLSRFKVFSLHRCISACALFVVLALANGQARAQSYYTYAGSIYRWESISQPSRLVIPRGVVHMSVFNAATVADTAVWATGPNVSQRIVRVCYDIVNSSTSAGPNSLDEVIRYAPPNTIVLLCPYWFNGEKLAGKNPTEFNFEAIRLRLNELAYHYKDNQNVWMELWNEPFNETFPNDLAGHQAWYNAMFTLASVIRNPRDPNNLNGPSFPSLKMIVVPVSNWGTNETCLLRMVNGKSMGQTMTNAFQDRLIFDIHPYEFWIFKKSDPKSGRYTREEIGARIKTLKDAQCTVFFGEFSPKNNTVIMDVAPLLGAFKDQGVGGAAFLWNNRNGEYGNGSPAALYLENGQNYQPNNMSNRMYGTKVRNWIQGNN
jgi:hypothetical protein